MPLLRRGFSFAKALMAASLLLATACPVMATDFIVSNANDIDDASRDARPGDTLLMNDGVWNNLSLIPISEPT